VQFSSDAKPETFRASFNDIDITAKFRKSGKKAKCLVGLADGLNVTTKIDYNRKINLLKIKIQGIKSDQSVAIDTIFFVEIDRLAAIGVDGGALQSLEGNFLINIPQNALSTTTPIALTKIYKSKKFRYAYELAPIGTKFRQPVIVALRYDPRELPEGVVQDDLFLVAGYEFPRKLDNIVVDKNSHTVSGIIKSLSKIYLSYYLNIGKTLSDFPFTDDFRLPIGDNSDESYSCGTKPQPPSENDLGEILPLLHHLPNPDSPYPEIVFNPGDTTNTWRVTTGYNRKMHLQPAAEERQDSEPWYLKDKSIYSQGEDWSFVDQDSFSGHLPIHAAADGLIIHNDQDEENTLVLAHQTATGPVISIYSGLSEKSLCSVGTTVSKGNVIGLINRTGDRAPYLRYKIGKKSLLEVVAETGEIKVPATWYGNWTHDSIYRNYYDPTHFIINKKGQYMWDFSIEGDNEGWLAENVKEYANGDTFQVKDGMLSIMPSSSSLRLISYPLNTKTDYFTSLFIKLRNNSSAGYGKLYFATDDELQYSEDKSMRFEIHTDDKLYEYRVEISNNPKWRGTLVGLRIVFPDTRGDGTEEVNIDAIRLGRAYLARTPDTGQTKCYNNIQEITCPSPDEPFFGQDAQYTKNIPQYVIQTSNNDEVVIDQITGLIWQRRDDGTKRTWKEALDYCENLSLAGYSDWRLPEKKELQSIIDFGSFSPALDTTFFPYALLPGDCYWSATTEAFLALSARKVCLGNGKLLPSVKNDYHFVRAVRGSLLAYGHFIDNKDGTVTDITTGLTWQQTETEPMTWEKALAYCENLELAGYRDWRLPNIRELLRLVDDTSQEPSINTFFFPGCRPSPYWSSTTFSQYPTSAWHVQFYDGQINGNLKSRLNYVRAVRGGE